MKKSSKYILITAFIVWHILPYLMQIVILQATKHSISSLVYILCQGMGLVGLLGIGYIALKQKGIVKKTELIYTGLYFVAYVLVTLAIRGPINRIDNITLRLVLGLLMFVIAIMLIASALMRGFCKIKVTLVIVGLVIVYFVVNTVISIGFEILHLAVGSNVVTQLLSMIIVGLIEGIIFNKCLEYVAKKEPEREFKEEKIKKKLIPAIIAGGISVVSIVCMIPGTRPAAMMVERVEEHLRVSSENLNKGKISKAIEEYDIALSYINVLRYASGLEHNDGRLRKAMDEDLMFVEYLVWEKQEKYGDIEYYYQTVNQDINIGIPLLDYYSDIKKEYTDKEIHERDYGERIKGITKQMIANNQFTNDTLSVKEIEKKGKYFEKKFEKYLVTEEFLTMLQTIEKISINDEITKDDMDVFIECANQEPDNLFIQFMAVSYGTYFKIDDARHYSGVSDCIERVVTKYEEDKSRSEVEEQDVYLWAANNLMEIGYYEKALEYIDLLEQNEENILLAAYCYHNLGLNDKCIEIVSILPEENYYASYYRTVSMIQNGQNKEALEEIVVLCELMESNKEEKGDIETLLFGLLQKAVIRDWTPVHQFGFYEPDNEEYKVIVEKNELLKQYMNALYYCYSVLNYEEAEKAIERVLELDSELIKASYFAGVVHMELGLYEDSIGYLEKTLENEINNIASLRVLSRVYDLMGNYEASYKCCLMLKELVPSTDHDFDIYGVGYHNNQLLLQLEKELGVER